jgi:site-specific recombinase XerC
MPLPEVVSLNAVGFGLGLDQHFRGYQFSVWLPSICKKDRHFKPLQSFKHFAKGCGTSVAALPVDQLAGIAAIFVSESKTGKPRHVYLTEEGKTLFDGLTDRQSQESAIFTLTKPRTGQISPWQRNDQGRFLKEAYTKAGIETVTFHELRHTYASTLVNRGCSLYVVAQQLGHSGTNMVEKHYGHLAPNTVRDEVLRAMPTLGIMDAPKAKEKKPKSAKR